MSRLQFRSVFISDVHLGTASSQASFLLDFLNQLDCEHLYLVGDIFDLWQIKKKGAHWPASHNAVVNKIFDIAANGTKVSYIPGNHDEVVRPYAGNCINGVEIKMNAEHLTADGRRFFVSHGDEFDGVVRFSKALRTLGDGLYIVLMAITNGLNRLRQRFGWSYWSLCTFIKSKSKRAQAYIEQYEQSAARAAREKGYDGYICGHIHKMGIREIGDVTYCNTGDWVEHCTALTEDHKGELKIIQWTDRVAVQNPNEAKPQAVGDMPQALAYFARQA